jgi:uncharacterized protein YbaP (TraB family)
MLWAVDGGNLHLLASVHMLDQARSVLYQKAEQVYRSAERVTFEHDTTAPLNMSLVENQPGLLLSQQVPASIFSNAAAEWSKVNLPPQRLEEVRPWAAAITIVAHRAHQRGLQEAYGVDKGLWVRAAADGKTREVLELMNDALASLASGPISEQTLWLDLVSKPGNMADGYLDEMLNAWCDHDEETMARLLAERLAIMPVGFGNAVTGRNHLWMPALLNRVAEPIPTLVVVGALHCVGDEGLPSLLKKAGVSLTRVA